MKHEFLLQEYIYNIKYIPKFIQKNPAEINFIKITNKRIDNFNIFINNNTHIDNTCQLTINNSDTKNNNINIYIYNLGKNIRLNIFGSNINFYCFTNKYFNSNFVIYDNSNILIGEDSTSNGMNAFLLNSDLKIKRDTMFSHDVILQTDDQHKIIDLKTNNIINYKKNKRHSIIINDHVWIGKNTLIKKNINIGIGSIISSGSVVTKDVNEFTCVAGVPAKIIKKDVSWIRNKITTRERELFTEYQNKKNF